MSIRDFVLKAFHTVTTPEIVAFEICHGPLDGRLSRSYS